MELVFWQHINGGRQPEPMTLDQVFAWNIRFQIMCRTQEEKDLLEAYQLMYGREVQVDVWDQWKHQRRMRKMQSHYDHSKLELRLLPITFTTFRTHDGQLRGL